MFLIKHFVASNIHLGHKINKWNPRTSNFLLGIKDNIFIIDLEQTVVMIKRALTFVKKICLNRGYIFYVPSFIQNESFIIRKNIENKIKSFPINLQDNNLILLTPKFVSSSKQRGMLYAFTQKRKNLLSLGLSSFKSTVLSSATTDKKGNDLFSTTLSPAFMTANQEVHQTFFLKPEALFLLNTNNHVALIREAAKLQIPVIAIIDSDSSVLGIRYPIPGNDDTIETQKIYTELLINTIIDAKKKEAKLILLNKN